MTKHFLRKVCWFLVLSPILVEAAGNSLQIEALNLNGQISWSNAFASGVCTVESASVLSSNTAWTPLQNYFTTNSAGAGNFALLASNNFFRLRAVEIFTNTPQALSLIHI